MPSKLTLSLLAGGTALLLVGATVFALTAQADADPFHASAGEDVTVECAGPHGAVVRLDGTASRPAPNDTLTRYDWYEGWNTTQERLVGSGPTLDATLPLGEHRLTLRVMNSTNETRYDNVTVRVVDTTAPTLTAIPSKEGLWPPNHKLQTLHVDVEARDACTGATWVLESATSDDADDGRGDGRTTDDVQDAQLGTADEDVVLRAERMGGGDGREYTLAYKARDGAGNVARATVVVRVPPEA